MTLLPRSFALPALLLASALVLSACGGGSASPPPDTVAPGATISSSASGGTAAGPITFTFTFSEDVGSSFTAADVAITNGTAGTFTKVSGTQYTLVVTPSPNSNGNVGVSVAASAVTDVAGNPLSGTITSTQAYDTRPPSVTIASSASGSTASGDVTFTFSFSKDVGTSFTTDDITVTGGTKGTFTRASGTQATLVVSPTANSAGNIVVSVAAGAVTDAAGQASAAPASTTQAFSTASPPTMIVRANATGAPSYDTTNGKALPGNYTTGNYSANAGEAFWWGGNYAEQIQVGFGFSKTNTAQWGYGIYIANGGTGWDIANASNYHVTLGTNNECAGVCKVTLRMVSASNAACVADAKVTLTNADITTAYDVPLSSFAVSGCTTNTITAFKALKVAELHFQMLRADMQFTTSGDPNLYPNGLGVGGNLYFNTPVSTPASSALTVVRTNGAGTPAYDTTNGKALPGNYTTGNYSANAGEAFWWGGNYAEQIQVGFGFSKTNTAQWGYGIYIANGGTGWDISGTTKYHVTLGTNNECAGVCKVTLRMVSASNAACVADAKVTLTAADITTAYTVNLADFVVSGCTTNTVAAFKALKVAELHFQMLRADMQFNTSGDPNLYPNGLGVGGGITFD